MSDINKTTKKDKKRPTYIIRGHTQSTVAILISDYTKFLDTKGALGPYPESTVKKIEKEYLSSL